MIQQEEVRRVAQYISPNDKNTLSVSIPMIYFAPSTHSSSITSFYLYFVFFMEEIEMRQNDSENQEEKEDGEEEDEED